MLQLGADQQRGHGIQCTALLWVVQFEQGREQEVAKSILMRDNPKWCETLSNALWRQFSLYKKSRIRSGQAICQSPKPYSITENVLIKLIRKRFDEHTLDRLLALHWQNHLPDLYTPMMLIYWY